MNSKSHGQLMKTLLAGCAAALLTLTSTGLQSAGGADTYPDHPVRVIVPFPQGGLDASSEQVPAEREAGARVRDATV